MCHHALNSACSQINYTWTRSAVLNSSTRARHSENGQRWLAFAGWWKRGQRPLGATLLQLVQSRAQEHEHCLVFGSAELLFHDDQSGEREHSESRAVDL